MTQITLKHSTQFTLLFVLIVIAEVLCTTFEELAIFEFGVKPMIMTSLIGYFIYHSAHVEKKVRYQMIFAMICSLVGDIFMMFSFRAPIYFILGILFFLITHIVYTVIFIANNDVKLNRLLPFMFVGVIYASYLLNLMFVNLGEMFIPVTIYMIVILAMAQTAFLRKERVNQISYRLVLFGALLFLLSDSIIAINRFHESVPYSGLWVMTTYAAAQYLIMRGILRQ